MLVLTRENGDVIVYDIHIELVRLLEDYAGRPFLWIAEQRDNRRRPFDKWMLFGSLASIMHAMIIIDVVLDFPERK